MGVRRFLLTSALVALVAPALLAGPASAGPTEVPSERTPAGRVIDNGDGTFTLRQELPAESLHAAATGWTSVYSTWPNDSYWNGTNTSDGRAGAGFSDWSQPAIVARSYFQFDLTPSRGKHVLGANLNLFGSFSASCGFSGVSLRFTGPVNPGTTWNTQPPVYTSQERTESGFCNGGRWINFDVTNEIAQSAGQAAPTATFGVAAQNERDRFGWRNYGTANTGQTPVLSITYEG